MGGLIYLPVARKKTTLFTVWNNGAKKQHLKIQKKSFHKGSRCARCEDEFVCRVSYLASSETTIILSFGVLKYDWLGNPRKYYAGLDRKSLGNF